ncbi:hypothetical protein C8J56DRAFT_786832, partial [Mycena floridula]
WTAPIYQFFKPPVLKFDDTGRPYHWFACDLKTCRGQGAHGVKRYADTSDSSGTKNLKRHAKTCFGEDALMAADKAKSQPQDQSTTAWGRQSSKPAPHKPFTLSTMQATLVQWITESNRPVHITKVWKFVELPLQSTIACDIETAFEHSLKSVSDRLNKYSGKLSFTTDAWTSPNHRAFVAWTIHLQHEGKPLDFLLDIYEVPTVCSSICSVIQRD